MAAAAADGLDGPMMGPMGFSYFRVFYSINRGGQATASENALQRRLLRGGCVCLPLKIFSTASEKIIVVVS